MSRRRKKKTGHKHSSKFGMEKIKDIKLLHYIIPMRNAVGVCLVAETGFDDTLFTTKHCFFVEETKNKKGLPTRSYSLDNKEYADSMLNKFLNANVFVEFLDFAEPIKKDIQQYIDYYINMSKYKLSDKAKVFLLNQQECYDLILKL